MCFRTEIFNECLQCLLFAYRSRLFVGQSPGSHTGGLLGEFEGEKETTTEALITGGCVCARWKMWKGRSVIH